jgi:hypothetical protein
MLLAIGPTRNYRQAEPKKPPSLAHYLGQQPPGASVRLSVNCQENPGVKFEDILGDNGKLSVVVSCSKEGTVISADFSNGWNKPVICSGELRSGYFFQTIPTTTTQGTVDKKTKGSYSWDRQTALDNTNQALTKTAPKFTIDAVPKTATSATISCFQPSDQISIHPQSTLLPGDPSVAFTLSLSLLLRGLASR